MKTGHKILLSLISLLWLFPAALPARAQNAPEDLLRLESAELAPPVARPPERLRVVSFNVHYARDLELLARSLKSNPVLQDADIFLIQEIESYAGEGASRARKLAEALGLNFVYAPARTTRSGGTHGLAILSRYPLSEIEVLDLPRNDLGSKTRHRIALGATVEAAGRRLRLYNLHLDTRINIEERLAQLAPVVEAARRQPLEAVVIGGDFNTNPFRWAWGGRLPWFRSNQATVVDSFMDARGFGTPLTESGFTTHRKLWKVRLDSIYVRGMVTGEFDVEEEVDVSDHLPVWLDLAWPPAASTAAAPPDK